MSNDKYDIKPMPEKVCDYRENMWRNTQMLVQDMRGVMKTQEKQQEAIDKHGKDIFRIKVIGPIGIGLLAAFAYARKVLGL